MAYPDRSAADIGPPALGRIGQEIELSGEPDPNGQCQFEIYREDQRKVTSTRISGGMWRWRLCSSAGAVLARSGSYQTDRECIAAIAALRNFAATARLIK